MITGAGFTIFFLDSAVNPKDVAQPIHKFGNSEFTVTTPTKEYEKQLYLEFQNDAFETDYGYIFSDLHSESFISFNSIQEVNDYGWTEGEYLIWASL